MSLLSLGNLKLPKTTAIFNLPSGMSCPGKTDLCSKYCYAKKADRIWKNALSSRMRNFELSRSPEFEVIMQYEITNLKGKIDTVRIHESGDFYNQQYFNKWVAIASKNPDLKFYAYTKSWFLDLSKKPDNFIVLFSVDKTSNKNIPFGANGVAVMVEDMKPDPDFDYGNAKLCYDIKNDKHLKCKDGCNYCYADQSNKSVIFFRH